MTWSNVPIPVGVSIPLLIAIVAEMLLPKPILSPSLFLTALAALLVALSLSLILWSVREVGSHTINSPDALVTSGPFALSRNPMYVAWLLIVVAAFCLTGSLWFILGLAAASLLTHYVAIVPEERFLRERFGDAYLRYCTSVRRYL